MLHVHVSYRRNKIVCCHSAVFVVWLGLSTETTTETCSKDIQGWKDARIKVFVSFLDISLEMSEWHPSRFLQYHFRQLFSFRYRRLKNFLWFNIKVFMKTKFYSFQQKLQVGFKPRASMSAACMRRSLYQESNFFNPAFNNFHVLVISINNTWWRLDIDCSHVL